MAGLYFEELTVGRTFDHAWTRTVTEMDNVLFSSLTMNVQPCHLDEEFAARPKFGQRIVNSLFTLGLMIGITVNDTDDRHHDRQSRHDRRRVPQAGVPRRHAQGAHGGAERRESKSRPDAGIIEFAHTATTSAASRRRSAAPGADAQAPKA
jgi:hypothetical protein